MGWDRSVVPDPQDPQTFERSKLRWDEATTGRHARMLEVYRELAALRRREPAITDPSFSTSRAVVDEERALGASGPGRSRDRAQPRRRTSGRSLLGSPEAVWATDAAVAACRGRLCDARRALRRRAAGGPGQLTPRKERSVRTIGPSSVIATVCSEWAPREPSALRSVQPSGSVMSSSVVARNHGSRATTSPARSG